MCQTLPACLFPEQAGSLPPTSTQGEHTTQGTKTLRRILMKMHTLGSKNKLMSFKMSNANTRAYSFYKHEWLYAALKALWIFFPLPTSSPSSFLYSLCPPPTNQPHKVRVIRGFIITASALGQRFWISTHLLLPTMMSIHFSFWNYGPRISKYTQNCH